MQNNAEDHVYYAKNEAFHSEFLQLMWPNPQETAHFVIFTEEILIEKPHFLCSGEVMYSV